VLITIPLMLRCQPGGPRPHAASARRNEKKMLVNDVLSSPPQSFARCPKQNKRTRCAAPGKCRCCPMESSELTRRVRSKQTGDRERDMSERRFFPSRLSLTKLVAPPAALSLPARVAGPPRLALLVSHVAVPRRRARELRAAPRAVALCRRAGLFALVP